MVADLQIEKTSLECVIFHGRRAKNMPRRETHNENNASENTVILFCSSNSFYEKSTAFSSFPMILDLYLHPKSESCSTQYLRPTSLCKTYPSDLLSSSKSKTFLFSAPTTKKEHNWIGYKLNMLKSRTDMAKASKSGYVEGINFHNKKEWKEIDPNNTMHNNSETSIDFFCKHDIPKHVGNLCLDPNRVNNTIIEEKDEKTFFHKRTNMKEDESIQMLPTGESERNKESFITKDEYTKNKNANNNTGDDNKNTNNDTRKNKFCGINLKWIALLCLIIQTVCIVILLRYSKTHPSSSSSTTTSNFPSVNDAYINTTVVAMAEMMKLVASTGLIFFENRMGIFRTFSLIKCEILEKPAETCKVGVPALLYTLQNNLIFIAIENLSAAVYQVSYQLKILTTALLSVALLNKKLKFVKWISLVILTLGVAIIQLKPEQFYYLIDLLPTNPLSQDGLMRPRSLDESSVTQTSTLNLVNDGIDFKNEIRNDLNSYTINNNPEVSGSVFVGLLAVFCACLTSGFAGVYFEIILKQSTISIWLRNIQLALFGASISFASAYIYDYHEIRQNGFFKGYSCIVWMIICLQAFGGLIVATVLKYADNILKCFGNAASIILSCLFSWLLLHDFEPTFTFCIGTVLVMFSTYLYVVDDPLKCLSCKTSIVSFCMCSPKLPTSPSAASSNSSYVSSSNLFSSMSLCKKKNRHSSYEFQDDNELSELNKISCENNSKDIIDDASDAANNIIPKIIRRSIFQISSIIMYLFRDSRYPDERKTKMKREYDFIDDGSNSDDDICRKDDFGKSACQNNKDTESYDSENSMHSKHKENNIDDIKKNECQNEEKFLLAKISM